MTPQERQILEEAETQAFETAQAYNEPRNRGVRPEPTIDQTETSIESQPFGLDFAVDSTGQANVDNTPVATTIPPPVGTVGACCFDGGLCFTLTEDGCNAAGGTYQGDNTDCDPNPC